MIEIDAIDFAKGGGLVTVVCQDHLTGAVLMVAHASRDSLERTLETGEMHYWSRTRGLWRKGESSGSVQRVVDLLHDCDADAILAQVDATLPACHTGTDTCFGTLADAAGVLERLDAVIASRAASAADPKAAARIETTHDTPPTAGDNTEAATPAHPRSAGGGSSTPSYTQRLFADRNLRLKKLGEEAAELVAACADGDAQRACDEAADLLYHALVAVRATGGSLRGVQAALARRRPAR